MPKHILNRYLPSPERIAALPGLGPLRHRLGDPSLWHLNRRSAAGAVFWGLWFAFMPMPFHTIPAVLVALFFRVNLPLCILLVWVNNPLTLIPILYASYHVGVALLPSRALATPPTIADIRAVVANIFHVGDPPPGTHSLHVLGLVEPIVLGMLVSGFVLGCLGYLAMNFYWRRHVRRAWAQRQQRAIH